MSKSKKMNRSRTSRGRPVVHAEGQHLTLRRWYNAANSYGVTADGAVCTLTNVNYLTVQALATAGSIYGSLLVKPQLRDMSAVTDIKNLFNTYRIKEFTFRLTAFSNTDTGPISANYMRPGVLIHTAIDYDGDLLSTLSYGTTETASQLTLMRQYPSYKMEPIYRANGTSIIRRVVSPKCEIGTAAQMVPSPWLNSTSDSTSHYGLGVILELLNPDTTNRYYEFKIECELLIECRGLS